MGRENGFSLFGRKKRKPIGNSSLPRAVAFVDYEHWYISMEKIHHRRPNIQAWFSHLKQHCNIVEVVFFANFTKFKEKEKEIKRIRAFTNKIIDTYNPDLHYKKDYTDFIILDNIYQKALLDHEIETFIIFSGDGHFSSATAFLKNFCSKKVCIYGVKSCISQNLIKSADSVFEVPFEDEIDLPYYNMIFTTLKESETNDEIQPTFMRTVDLIASKYNVPNEKIRSAMISMIDRGFIVQIQERNQRNTPTRVLHADWKKIAEDGIWIQDASIV